MKAFIIAILILLVCGCVTNRLRTEDKAIRYDSKEVDIIAKVADEAYTVAASRRIVTELGIVYVGMPKQDLPLAGYTKYLLTGHYKDGSEEWVTYLNWHTQRRGDVVTFYVVDGEVRGWKEYPALAK